MRGNLSAEVLTVTLLRARLLIFAILACCGPLRAQQVYSHPVLGYSVQYPASAFFTNDERFAEHLSSASASLLLGAPTKGLGFQFVVLLYSPESEVAFNPNINCMTVQAPDNVSDTRSYAVACAAAASHGEIELESGPTPLGIHGKTFFTCVFLHKRPIEQMRYQSYCFLEPTQHLAYILTVTDRVRGWNDHFPLLEKIVESFKLP